MQITQLLSITFCLNMMKKTGKKIVDESGRSILRKEFYMDGLNCDPMSFDKECELTNAHFYKK